MKVSSVARWKSFIDKLHPQLPLTTKESQRLLTALTSSFRKHLDEAHPTLNAEEEQKARLAVVGVAKPQTRNWNSSASHADQHLASVLTSPLFVKGGKRPDYASAKLALAKDASKDPIELLEEYQQQHAATVPIAALCLQSFRDRLKALDSKERLARIQEIEPGRRTFLWLLQSGFHSTSHAADNLEFQDLLAYFLVREGRENDIWKWIQIDTQVSESTAIDANATNHHSYHKNMLHAYRWRGRLLCALVIAKLGPEAAEGPAVVIDMTYVNDALEALFRACDIRASASRCDHLYWIPLGTAYTRLARVLRRGTYQVKHGLDAAKLERLISYMPLIFDTNKPLIMKSEIARLQLINPHKPSAGEAYDLFQELLRSHETPGARNLSPMLTHPKTPSQAHSWSLFIARTIVVLRAQGQHEQASRLESIVRLRCPQIFQSLARNVERLSQSGQFSKRLEEQEDEHDQSRLCFPTFV